MISNYKMHIDMYGLFEQTGGLLFWRSAIYDDDNDTFSGKSVQINDPF